jgi:AraC-like DNA-binding protein/ligand-binding sensor protein
MPQIIRQALSARIQNLPALREVLEDFTETTGLPVRFLPQTETVHAGSGEPAPLCARLWSEPAGCRLCVRFRQKLREEAAHHAAVATCDAGLWEALVPVRIGGQSVGHLLLSGCIEGEPATRAQNRARHLLGRAGVTLTGALISTLVAQSPVVAARRREALVRVLQLAADRLALMLTEHLVTAPDALPAVVARACGIVHAEFAVPLRLPALAARLEVSEGHFSRIFHHATGLRFVEYLARYRAERARLMLMEGDRPVAEIAGVCGFASLSQFNRVFRAVYQTSPRLMRAGRARGRIKSGSSFRQSR